VNKVIAPTRSPIAKRVTPSYFAEQMWPRRLSCAGWPAEERANSILETANSPCQSKRAARQSRAGRPMVRTQPEAKACLSKLRLGKLPVAGRKITSRTFFVMCIEFYALRTASPVDTNSATRANLVANQVFAHRTYPSSLTFCI
jgi:hypothetical protein